jgi:hypothetical protein
MAGEDTKQLEAKCFCGAVHFTLTVALSDLPLPVYICHCSQCRYRSGTLCIFHAPIRTVKPVEFISPSAKENITTYRSPGREAKLDAWQFCSTCGCHVGRESPVGNETWIVSTSMFADHGPDNFYFKQSIYGKSAKDGGLAAMLTHIGGRGLETWDPPDDREDAKIVEAEPEHDNQGAERLRAQCYCGGVSFTLGRPTEEHINNKFHSNYVSPLDKTKWRASVDVCNDCRIVNGTHVASWAFVPLDSCQPPMGKDLKIGTAKTYSSSPGVLRSFCGTCGATVFFSCQERTPTEETMVVDISTGIFRAPEGSMASNWLTWRTRLGNIEYGKPYAPDFFEALEAGMKRWTVERQGGVAEFGIP